MVRRAGAPTLVVPRSQLVAQQPRGLAEQAPRDVADEWTVLIDALDEARRQAVMFDESIGTESSGVNRQDLTAETIITIDPVTARDFDDAVWCDRTRTGLRSDRPRLAASCA